MRFARLFGAVSGLQDVLARPPSPELLERHRGEWPAGIPIPMVGSPSGGGMGQAGLQMSSIQRGVAMMDPAGTAAASPIPFYPGQPGTAISPQVMPQHMLPPHVGVGGPGVQTPNFNLPGGGAWTAPQQIVVSNASKSPGLAVAALVLGVGAFFFSLIPVVGFMSIPFAICGLALGISGVLRARKGFEGMGLSVAGIVGSVAALFVSSLYILAIGGAVNEIDSDPVDGFCNLDRVVQDPDC